MNKEDRKKYNGHYLFTFDEMANQKLERYESAALKNTPSLIYSLVIDMFRYIGDQREDEDILTECKNEERWFETHQWTKEDNDKWYNERLIPVLKKQLRLSKAIAEREGSWFMLQWSFKIVD